MVQIIVNFSMHVIKTVNSYNFVSKKKKKKKKEKGCNQDEMVFNKPKRMFLFFLENSVWRFD